MKAPPRVSNSDMPAANRTGRQRTAHQGAREATPVLASAIRPISDAVSKPSPNSRPTRYICQGSVMIRAPRPIRRLIIPRRSSPSSSAASSK